MNAQVPAPSFLRALVEKVLTQLGIELVWRLGEATLLDKNLSFSWLEQFSLPIRVARASLGHFHVRVPPGSQHPQLFVEASDLNILVSPRRVSDFDVDLDVEAQNFLRRRHDRLRRFTQRLISPLAKESCTAKGLLRASVQKALRVINLQIRKVHIRYEDPYTHPRFMFAATLLLPNVSLHDAQESTDGNDARVVRHLDVCLSVFWQSYETELFADSRAWKTKMAAVSQDLRCQASDASWPVHEVLPATKVRTELCWPCPNSEATFGLSVGIERLAARVTQAMVGDVLLLFDMVCRWHDAIQQLCEVTQPMAKLQQRGELHQSRARWVCAVRCVRRLCRERSTWSDWCGEDAQRVLRLHRTYLDLVEQEMVLQSRAASAFEQEATPQEIADVVMRIEAVVPEPILRIWRRQAAGHKFVPESDLHILGIRRRCRRMVFSGSSGASDVGVRACSANHVDFESVGGGAFVGAVVVSVSIGVFGLTFVELPTLHPHASVPFDLASRSAGTASFQSTTSERHPLADRAMLCGRKWPTVDENLPWVYMSTGDVAHPPSSQGGGYAVEESGGGVAAVARGVEVVLHQCKVQLRFCRGGQELSDVDDLERASEQRVEEIPTPRGDAELTCEGSIESVQVGKPVETLRSSVNNSSATAAIAGVDGALLLGCSCSSSSAAVSFSLNQGSSVDGGACLKMVLGTWSIATTPNKVDDLLAFFSDALPWRQGFEIFRCQTLPLTLKFPALHAPFARYLDERSMRPRRFNASLTRFAIAGSVGADDIRPRLEGYPETFFGAPISVLTEFKMVTLAMEKQQDAECITGRLEAEEIALEMPEVPRSVAANFRCSGKVTAKCGLMMSMHGSTLADLAGEAQSTECQVRAEDAPSLPRLEFYVPWCDISSVDGDVTARLLRLISGIVAVVPLRQTQCLLASSMRIWHPPTASPPKRRRNKFMKKDSMDSGSSELEEDSGVTTDGHWSCDIWAELSDDGVIELYSHPWHRNPTYAFRPLEMRSSRVPVSPKRGRTSTTSEEQHLEVRVALADVGAGVASGSSSPTRSRSASFAQSSAWVYFRTGDTQSRHWVQAWRSRQAQQAQIRKAATPRTLQSRGYCQVRVMVDKLRACVVDVLRPSMTITLEGLTFALCGWQQQVAFSLGDVTVEDAEHSVTDQRRHVLCKCRDGVDAADVEHGSFAPAATDGTSSHSGSLISCSFSLSQGVFLRIAPVRLCLSPSLLEYFTDTIHSLIPLYANLFYSSLASPLCGAWVTYFAERCFAFLHTVLGSGRSAGRVVEMSMDVPFVSITCLQHLTSIPVAVATLTSARGGLAVRMATSSSTFAFDGVSFETASCGLGNVSVVGASGQALIATPSTAFGEHPASQFLQFACQPATTMFVDGGLVVTGGCTHPVIQYCHSDACRLFEFLSDVFSAVACHDNHTDHYATAIESVLRSTPPFGRFAKVDVVIRLPSVHIAGGQACVQLEFGKFHLRLPSASNRIAAGTAAQSPQSESSTFLREDTVGRVPDAGCESRYTQLEEEGVGRKQNSVRERSDCGMQEQSTPALQPVEDDLSDQQQLDPTNNLNVGHGQPSRSPGDDQEDDKLVASSEGEVGFEAENRIEPTQGVAHGGFGCEPARDSNEPQRSTGSLVDDARMADVSCEDTQPVFEIMWTDLLKANLVEMQAQTSSTSKRSMCVLSDGMSLTCRVTRTSATVPRVSSATVPHENPLREEILFVSVLADRILHIVLPGAAISTLLRNASQVEAVVKAPSMHDISFPKQFVHQTRVPFARVVPAGGPRVRDRVRVVRFSFPGVRVDIEHNARTSSLRYELLNVRHAHRTSDINGLSELESSIEHVGFSAHWSTSQATKEILVLSREPKGDGVFSARIVVDEAGSHKRRRVEMTAGSPTLYICPVLVSTWRHMVEEAVVSVAPDEGFTGQPTNAELAVLAAGAALARWRARVMAAIRCSTGLTKRAGKDISPPVCSPAAPTMGMSSPSVDESSSIEVVFNCSICRTVLACLPSNATITCSAQPTFSLSWDGDALSSITVRIANCAIFHTGNIGSSDGCSDQRLLVRALSLKGEIALPGRSEGIAPPSIDAQDGPQLSLCIDDVVAKMCNQDLDAIFGLYYMATKPMSMDTDGRLQMVKIRPPDGFNANQRDTVRTQQVVGSSCDPPWLLCKQSQGFIFCGTMRLFKSLRSLVGADFQTSLRRGKLDVQVGQVSASWHDVSGDAYRIVMDRNRGSTTHSHLSEGTQTRHLVQSALTVEAWSAWACAWEPLLETCGVALAVSSGAQQGALVLSLHCEHIRACAKLSHIRRLRHQVECVYQTVAKIRDTMDMACPSVLQAMFDEKSNKSASPASNVNGVAQAGFDDVPLEPAAFSTVGGNGRPSITVRNDTGCKIIVSPGRSEDQLLHTAEEPFEMMSLEPGEDKVMFSVGAVPVADVLFQIHEDIEIPVKIQMGCGSPAVRAFPTPWPGVLLWQEVSATTSGVLCKLESPVMIVNETPLDLEVDFRSGLPQHSPAGTVRGLHIANTASAWDLRVRPLNVQGADWSSVLSLDQGSASVDRETQCGSCCELVVSIRRLLTDGLDTGGAFIGIGEVRTLVTVSARCVICNSLPVPLTIRLATTRWNAHGAKGAFGVSSGGASSKVVAAARAITHAPGVVVGEAATVWISVASPRCGTWAPPRGLALYGRMTATPIVLSCELGEDGDQATTFQVEVRSLEAAYGSPLRPRVLISLSAGHILCSYCPFPLRLSVPVDSGARLACLASAAEASVVEELLPGANSGGSLGKATGCWFVPGQVCELHGNPGRGPSSMLNTAELLSAGSFPITVGGYDVVVIHEGKGVAPLLPGDVGNIAGAAAAAAALAVNVFVVVPRFCICNRLRSALDARVKRPLVAEAEIMLLQSGTCVHIHPGSRTGAAPISFRLPSDAFTAADTDGRHTCPWSFEVDVCIERQYRRSLHSHDGALTGVLEISVVKQANGQVTVVVGASASAEFHVENHTQFDVHVQQALAGEVMDFANSQSVLGAALLATVPPCSALPIYPAIVWWPQEIDNRPTLIQLQSSRWRTQDWLTVDARAVDQRCNTTYADVPLYVLTIFDRNTHVVVVSSEPIEGRGVRGNEDSKPEDDVPSCALHVRVFCPGMAVSLIGEHVEQYRLTLSGLTWGADCSRAQGHTRFLLTIDIAQFDHVAQTEQQPSVFRAGTSSIDKFFTIGACVGHFAPCVVSDQRLHSALLVLDLLQKDTTTSVEYVDVRLSDLYVAIHARSLLGSALPFVVAYVGAQGDPHGSSSTLEADDSIIHLIASVVAACAGQRLTSVSKCVTRRRFRIAEFGVSPVSLTLTMDCQGLELGKKSAGPSPEPGHCDQLAHALWLLADSANAQSGATSERTHSVGGGFIEPANLTLHELVVPDMSGTIPSLTQPILEYYSHGLRQKVLQHIGQKEAPKVESISLADKLLRGLHSFVNSPFEVHEGSRQQSGFGCLGPRNGPETVAFDHPRHDIPMVAPRQHAPNVFATLTCMSGFCGRNVALTALPGSDMHVQAASSSGFQRRNAGTRPRFQEQAVDNLLTAGICSAAPATRQMASSSNESQRVLASEADIGNRSRTEANNAETVADQVRNAGQAVLYFVMQPLSDVWGGRQAPSVADANTSRGSTNAGTTLPTSSPLPRLLRGPHRLVTKTVGEDSNSGDDMAGLLQLLSDIRTIAGNNAPELCYEDHADAHEGGRTYLLTDVELLLAARRSTGVHIVSRWSLIGVEQCSVRADGTSVRFSSDIGMSVGNELQVGISVLRCRSAASAQRFAASIRRVVAEAQYRSIPSGACPGHGIPYRGFTLVSL